MEYKHGFGDLFSPGGEFWLGNDPLHYLTSQGQRRPDRTLEGGRGEGVLGIMGCDV